MRRYRKAATETLSLGPAPAVSASSSTRANRTESSVDGAVSTDQDGASFQGSVAESHVLMNAKSGRLSVTLADEEVEAGEDLRTA